MRRVIVSERTVSTTCILTPHSCRAGHAFFPRDFPDTAAGQDFHALSWKQILEKDSKKPRGKRLYRSDDDDPCQFACGALFGFGEMEDADFCNTETSATEPRAAEDKQNASWPAFCAVRAPYYEAFWPDASRLLTSELRIDRRLALNRISKQAEVDIPPLMETSMNSVVGVSFAVVGRGRIVEGAQIVSVLGDRWDDADDGADDCSEDGSHEPAQRTPARADGARDGDDPVESDGNSEDRSMSASENDDFDVIGCVDVYDSWRTRAFFRGWFFRFVDMKFFATGSLPREFSNQPWDATLARGSLRLRRSGRLGTKPGPQTIALLKVTMMQSQLQSLFSYGTLVRRCAANFLCLFLVREITCIVR